MPQFAIPAPNYALSPPVNYIVPSGVGGVPSLTSPFQFKSGANLNRANTTAGGIGVPKYISPLAGGGQSMSMGGTSNMDALANYRASKMNGGFDLKK